MFKLCPNCHAKNPYQRFTCKSCGTELTESGSELDALTYWDEGDAGNRHVLLCRVVMIAAAGVSLLIHQALPLLFGLIVCAVIFLKDRGLFGP